MIFKSPEIFKTPKHQNDLQLLQETETRKIRRKNRKIEISEKHPKTWKNTPVYGIYFIVFIVYLLSNTLHSAQINFQLILDTIFIFTELFSNKFT